MIVIALILLLLLLHWSQPVTAPLAYAILLIAAASPVRRCLECGVPRWLALLGTILLFVALLGLLVAVFAYAASAIIDGIGQHGAHIERTYRAAVRWAEEQGLAASAPLAEQIDMARVLAVAQTAIGGIHVVLAFVALTIVFLVLGLIEADEFRAKVREGRGGIDGGKILWAVDETGRKFRRYLLVRTFVSALTGVLTWGFALLVGLEFAAIWGLLAFVLNYIPFIGSVIAVVPPVLFAIAQFQSWQAALVVLAGMGAIQFTIGNYIDPRLEGPGAGRLAAGGGVLDLRLGTGVGGARRLYRRADDHRPHHLLRAVRADAVDRAPTRLTAPQAGKRLSVRGGRAHDRRDPTVGTRRETAAMTAALRSALPRTAGLLQSHRNEEGRPMTEAWLLTPLVLVLLAAGSYPLLSPRTFFTAMAASRTRRCG